MKIAFHTLLLLLSAVLSAVPSFALPNFGAMMQRGPNGEPSLLEKRTSGVDPLQLASLVTSLTSKIFELNAQVNVPEGGALLDMSITDITPDLIYQTFGVKRSSNSRSKHRGVMPLGEDADHPWQPRPAGAKRGPCPGLNTLANHGYIPRDGIVNPIQLLEGTFQGLNLSPDLAAILTALSFVMMGDFTQMKLSIGDRYGLGDGLNHHGGLEGDASVTRKDHYFGNSWDADPKLVAQFINETNTYGKGNVDIWSLANSRYRAWDFGRRFNPIFDFNPWRALVAYAESGFVHELLRGSFVRFDECMIKSWFLHERFPEGWSKRAVPFSAPEILAWAGVIFLNKPTIPGTSQNGFNPTPTSDQGFQQLASLLDSRNSGATLGRLVCDAGNTVMGFFPSQITNFLGGIGISGIGLQMPCI